MKIDKNTSFQMIADIDGDIKDLFDNQQPDTAPVLPVRNLVLFPGVVSPILIGRSSSKTLVQKAEKQGTIICVIPQRDPDIDDPQQEDLYEYGVYAKVMKLLTLPNGNVTAIVQAMGRMRLQDIVASTPYLEGIAKEVNDDGRLRCFYTINNVSSYRIAANSPNFMNISSRDEFQVDLIKKCFIPDDGYYYTSFDFSGLENCGSAAICKDEYMRAVICEGRDMHKENALFMFCMTDEEFKALKAYDEEHNTHYAKANRNGGKAASFSVLYGAGKETVGGTLWKYLNEKQVRVTPTEFARDRVIKVLQLEEKYKLAKTDKDKEEFFLKQYCEHANDFLNDFWSNRMKATKNWKDNNMDYYFKTGMALYPTGHIIHGMFNSLTINNAVIQGSSSCCTLYCLVMLDYLFKYFKMDVRLINIIHDDINTLTKKQKEEIIRAMALQKFVMEEVTFKAFPWLTFKLKAECEISALTWGDKKEFSEFIDYYNTNKEKIALEVDKALGGDYIFNNWN